MRKLISITFAAIALVWVLFSEPLVPLQAQVEPLKTISFWGIYDLPDIYEPIIERFQKAYPDVRVSYKQFPNAQDYHQVLYRQLEKGRGPDVFLFPVDQRDEYFPFINPTAIEGVADYAPLVQQHFAEDRLLYGLPLWIDTLMLYYNKRYYPQGVDQQWYRFGEQTKTISIGGIAMGRLQSLQHGWDLLKALFLQKDVELRGKPANRVFDSLEFFNRFAYPVDRFFNWSDNLSEGYSDREADSFARQRVAAIAGYSSWYKLLQLKSQQLKEEGRRGIAAEDIGVSPLPQFDEQNPRYLSKAFMLSVPLHSLHPNEAWAFIRFLTDEDNARYYQQATGRTPGRLLAEQEDLSERERVQLKQAQQAYTYEVSRHDQRLIEGVMERAHKDKRLIRGILDVRFD